jgi:dihydroorotase
MILLTPMSIEGRSHPRTSGSSERALRCALGILLLMLLPADLLAQSYDLLIKGGHVIDPRNQISAPLDVAVAGGVIARVAPDIPAAQAQRVVDASGFYVTPGLIDTHAHVFVGSTPGRYADGFLSVSPDDFTFRAGITTVVDPGNAGWRNFPAFKHQVIDQSGTRVLAFINIVGHGLSGTEFNNDLGDMDVEKTVAAIGEYPDIIVGVKFGHWAGEDYWVPFERAHEAARRAGQPLMLECNLPHLDVREALTRMRPGDIFAHSYEPGNRSLLDANGRVHDYVFAARDRGIVFDVTHGGASFRFSQAVPSVQQGFLPHTFGTDLHRSSMNGGMKDMLNVMSKFLNLGMSVDDIILRATWNSALSVNREDLGHLTEGAVADIAVLNRKAGSFGFIDSRGFRMDGDQKFEAELTVRGGRVVWDLNGIAAPGWNE